MTSSPSCALALSLSLLLAGCSSPPALVGEPELTLNPNGNTPLAGLLTFTTDQPVRATLTIGDGENSITATPNDAYVTSTS